MAQASRVSELQAVDLKYHFYQPERVVLQIPTLWKKRVIWAPSNIRRLCLEPFQMIVGCMPCSIVDVHIIKSNLGMATSQTYTVRKLCTLYTLYCHNMLWMKKGLVCRTSTQQSHLKLISLTQFMLSWDLAIASRWGKERGLIVVTIMKISL